LGATKADILTQVVLITGASSGIGYATALAYVRRGRHIGAAARRIERLAALEREISALSAPHGECLAIRADVCDADAMRQAVAQTVARFGRLDVLVANAGVGQRGALVESEWSDLETLLHTNIDGVLHSIRAAVPAMRQSGGGQIVIVSSVAAMAPAPYTAVYAASKAFVSSLARSLSLELELDTVSVTNLLVGVTDTEFSQRRLGTPGYGSSASSLPSMPVEQVAEAIVRATEGGRSKTVVLRWFDRLILLGNLIAPGLIGRQALKRYKTD
jgi:short-subunit dehydrogenase